MNNNDILRSLRYALNLSDPVVIDIFKLSEHEISQSYLTDIFKKEEEQGFVELSGVELNYFLNGLIIKRRGKRNNDKTDDKKKQSTPLTNNSILKKLRIALELKDEDIIEIFKLENIVLSKSEISAFFRHFGHRNYKECKDQYLRNFIKGLAIRSRK